MANLELMRLADAFNHPQHPIIDIARGCVVGNIGRNATASLRDSVVVEPRTVSPDRAFPSSSFLQSPVFPRAGIMDCENRKPRRETELAMRG